MSAVSRSASAAASPGALSDGELVARCRTGEATAWDELVTRFSRYVYAIAVRGFDLAQAEAEDVYQEVFARIYENLDKLRDDDAIRPWIAQTTRRLAIDSLRASARAVPAELPLDRPDDDAEQALAQLADALDVRAAMTTLPEMCGEILDRFFARDESYRTIGDALDIPAGTIASRISRCLARLREKLDGRNYDAGPSGGKTDD